MTGQRCRIAYENDCMARCDSLWRSCRCFPYAGCLADCVIEAQAYCDWRARASRWLWRTFVEAVNA